MPYIECVSLVNLYTPPKTNIASENGPGPKRKFHLPTNHQFLVDMLVFGGGGVMMAMSRKCCVTLC